MSIVVKVGLVVLVVNTVSVVMSDTVNGADATSIGEADGYTTDLTVDVKFASKILIFDVLNIFEFLEAFAKLEIHVVAILAVIAPGEIWSLGMLLTTICVCCELHTGGRSGYLFVPYEVGWVL